MARFQNICDRRHLAPKLLSISGWGVETRYWQNLLTPFSKQFSAIIAVIENPHILIHSCSLRYAIAAAVNPEMPYCSWHRKENTIKTFDSSNHKWLKYRKFLPLQERHFQGLLHCYFYRLTEDDNGPKIGTTMQLTVNFPILEWSGYWKKTMKIQNKLDFTA